jgi:hypothetical protein
VFRLNTGGGFVSAPNWPGLVFVMAETDLQLAERLQDKFAIGFGGSAGLFGTITDGWKAGLTFSGFYYPLIDDHSRLQATLAQNFRINRNNSIALTLKGEHTFGYDRYELKAGWNIYF